MDVSFIVPYKPILGTNYLENFLKSISDLDNKSQVNFEIIVVINGASKDYFQNTLVTHQNVKLYYLEEGNTSKARNLGILKSCGEVIIFVDSDILVSRNYISKVLGIFNLHPVVDMVSMLIKIDHAESFFSKFIGQPSNPIHDPSWNFCPCFDTSSLAVRRKSLLGHTRIFDENMKRMEDFDLSLCLVLDKNFITYFLDDELVLKRDNFFFSRLVKKFRDGKAAVYLAQKYKMRPASWKFVRSLFLTKWHSPYFYLSTLAFYLGKIGSQKSLDCWYLKLEPKRNKSLQKLVWNQEWRLIVGEKTSLIFWLSQNKKLKLEGEINYYFLTFLGDAAILNISLHKELNSELLNFLATSMS